MISKCPFPPKALYDCMILWFLVFTFCIQAIFFAFLIGHQSTFPCLTYLLFISVLFNCYLLNKTGLFLFLGLLHFYCFSFRGMDSSCVLSRLPLKISEHFWVPLPSETDSHGTPNSFLRKKKPLRGAEIHTF